MRFNHWFNLFNQVICRSLCKAKIVCMKLLNIVNSMDVLCLTNL